MASSPKLIELYKRDPLGTKTVIVQNLRTGIRLDNVQNYLEVICKDNIDEIFFPVNSLDIVLAVFENEVDELDVWQERAASRPFEGVVLNLQMLDKPNGLYITNLPERFSDEFLSLYFESKKSGGEEGTVENVRVCDVLGNKVATIKISSDTAIESILAKPTHLLKGSTLQIEPHYPSIHGHLINRVKQRKTGKNASNVMRQNKTDLHENMTATNVVKASSTDVVLLESEKSSPTVIVKGKPKERTTVNNLDLLENKRIHPNLTAQQSEEPVQPIIPQRHTIPSKPIPRNMGRLKILSDDTPQDQLREASRTHAQGQCQSPTSLEDSIPARVYTTNLAQESEHFEGGNVATVKPVVRNPQRQISNEGQKSKGQKKRKTNFKVKKENKTEQVELDFVEKLNLPPVKITMLIIWRFPMKIQSESRKVEFKVNDGIVILKGATRDDINIAKLKLYECLDSVVSKSKTLKPPRTKFFSRTSSSNCIKSRSKAKKVRVAFEVSETEDLIRAYAFSERDAESGLKLVEEEITVLKIQMNPGQEQLLNHPDWEMLVTSHDTGLTTIYNDKSSKNIFIESFLEDKAKEAHENILQYLEAHVPKKSVKVILENAKARCFKSCFLRKIQQDAERKNVQFSVDEISSLPLKISVNIEGEVSQTSAVTDTIKQIWHEPVDFKKVTDRDEDKWLILKGLGGSNGQRFLTEFEKSNNCFIDKIREGEFIPVKPRMKVEDVRVTEYDTSEDRHFATSSEMPHDDLQQKWTRHDEMFEEMSLDSDDDEVHVPIARRQSDQDMLRRFSAPQPREGYVRRSISSQGMTKPRQREPRLREVKSTSLQMMRTTVKLTQGEIARQRVDVLVNIVSPKHNMKEGVVSRAFVQRGGPEIVQLYETAKMLGDSSGTVVETPACGRLKSKCVFHVVLVQGERYCQQTIQRVMSDIFQMCQSKGYTSIAFPPLGIGRMYQYKPDAVAMTMLQEIHKLSQGLVHQLKEITFVVFDDATYTVFENEFKTFNANPMGRRGFQPVARPFYNQDPFESTSVFQEQQQLHNFLSLQNQSPSIQRPIPQPRKTVTSRIQSADRLLPKRCDNRRSIPPSTSVPSGKYDREQTRMKQRRQRKSRFPDKKAISNLKIVVFAENKDICTRARNELGRSIRKEFLHEDTIDKRHKISEVTKKKIIDILASNDIESIKGKDKYTLRGCRKNVTEARMQILEIMLNEKDSTEEKRKRRGNVKRETKEYAKFMIEEEPLVPTYWKLYKPDLSLKNLLISFKDSVTGKNYTKVRLDQNDGAYLAILKMINATFDPSMIGQGQDAKGLEMLKYSKMHVVNIQRIENLDLYAKYTGLRQNMFRKLYHSGDVKFSKIENHQGCTGAIQTGRYLNSYLDKDLHSEVNEVLLFHGTKHDNIKVICSSGLDPRLSSGRSMFGSGVYGAEKAMKADQYADDKTSRSGGPGNKKKIFLIRMLLGNSYVCTDQNPHKYRRPPCTSCFMDDCTKTNHANKFGHIFDSVVGDNGRLFREFVVYDGAMCYPEYLITYERI